MATEREELLNEEVANLEEETKKLAEKVQELVGVDCASGACVFDPEMIEVEEKIDEIQSRKKMIEKIRASLEACDT